MDAACHFKDEMRHWFQNTHQYEAPPPALEILVEDAAAPVWMEDSIQTSRSQSYGVLASRTWQTIAPARLIIPLVYWSKAFLMGNRQWSRFGGVLPMWPQKKIGNAYG